MVGRLAVSVPTDDELLPDGWDSSPGPPRSRTPQWVYQLALVVVQVADVCGAIVYKSALEKVGHDHSHPLLFVFYRTLGAGPVMFGYALYCTGVALPRAADLPRVVAAGVCLFLNQGLFILGLSLSGALIASCMQPAIPVFTVMLTVVAGYERGTCQKGLGILLAVGGAVLMVLGGGDGGGEVKGASYMLLGNLCLVGNTMAMAMYFLLVKSLTRAYSSLCVAAWAYLGSASCFAVTCAFTVPAGSWALQQPLIWPLLYWILCCSVIAYFVVTWATAHLPASEVAAYQCLQPMIGTALAVVVLHEQPSWWDCGALGVIAGLLVVSYEASLANVLSLDKEEEV